MLRQVIKNLSIQADLKVFVVFCTITLCYVICMYTVLRMAKDINSYNYHVVC